MYRIRFHGRGGQGMKTASRILGRAFFLEGFEVQDAPRYGAERRGAPIFAYVRADKKEIHERGIIIEPDLVIVADESLIPLAAAGILNGINKKTVLLINSIIQNDEWMDRLNLSCRIISLPLSESKNIMEVRYIGAYCVGAAARLLGVISIEKLNEAIAEELSSFDQNIIKLNQDYANEAYTKASSYDNCVNPGTDNKVKGYRKPDWISLSFENANISSPSIFGKLTSEAVKTGLWRTTRPVIDYDVCKHCWWLCSTYCPDSAINVQNGLPQIDYDHCKGCMICMTNCPPHAISSELEEVKSAGESR